jgi:hypothetical protein
MMTSHAAYFDLPLLEEDRVIIMMITVLDNNHNQSSCGDVPSTGSKM